MKEIAKQIEIIAKFSTNDKFVTPEFQNGQWLIFFKKSATKDVKPEAQEHFMELISALG